jgi:hypothetical protein
MILDAGPGGTPGVQTVKALNFPDVRARLAEFEFQTYGNSPKEFAEMMKADFAKMATVIRKMPASNRSSNRGRPKARGALLPIVGERLNDRCCEGLRMPAP